MIRERFRTNYNIFGDNIVGEESESESPFNIQMLQSEHEAYAAPIQVLSESTSMQTESNLFEDRLEQESPFRIIQYPEAQVPLLEDCRKKWLVGSN
jgi:hypothetical protein